LDFIFYFFNKPINITMTTALVFVYESDETHTYVYTTSDSELAALFQKQLGKSDEDYDKIIQDIILLCTGDDEEYIEDKSAISWKNRSLSKQSLSAVTTCSQVMVFQVMPSEWI
jgi:hypothetical protein